MNQDNNQKKTENLIDQKEEKDFLAREEIKTMEKDISRLRETEADRERERVSRIKTAEEIARDKEREKLAQRASLERDLAEKEAMAREERIKRMREEREAKKVPQTPKDLSFPPCAIIAARIIQIITIPIRVVLKFSPQNYK